MENFKRVAEGYREVAEAFEALYERTKMDLDFWKAEHDRVKRLNSTFTEDVLESADEVSTLADALESLLAVYESLYQNYFPSFDLPIEPVSARGKALDALRKVRPEYCPEYQSPQEAA